MNFGLTQRYKHNMRGGGVKSYRLAVAFIGTLAMKAL